MVKLPPGHTSTPGTLPTAATARGTRPPGAPPPPSSTPAAAATALSAAAALLGGLAGLGQRLYQHLCQVEAAHHNLPVPCQRTSKMTVKRVESGINRWVWGEYLIADI